MPDPMARIAKRVGFFAPLRLLQSGEMAGCSQRFSASNRTDFRFSATNTICGLVQEQYGAVAIGQCGLHPVSRVDPEVLRNLRVHRTELRPSELGNHGKGIAIDQNTAARICICAAQGARH